MFWRCMKPSISQQTDLEETQNKWHILEPKGWLDFVLYFSSEKDIDKKYWLRHLDLMMQTTICVQVTSLASCVWRQWRVTFIAEFPAHKFAVSLLDTACSAKPLTDFRVAIIAFRFRQWQRFQQQVSLLVVGQSRTQKDDQDHQNQRWSHFGEISDNTAHEQSSLRLKFIHNVHRCSLIWAFTPKPLF